MRSKETSNTLTFPAGTSRSTIIPLNILDPEHQIIFTRHIPFIESILKKWPDIQLDGIHERFITVRLKTYWAYDRDLELLIRKILTSLRVYYPHGN